MITKEKASKMLPIIQAWAEGKPLQAMYLKGGYSAKYEDLDDIDNLDFENYEYRIKPERKYRPYNSAEEFLEAQKEHGIYFKNKAEHIDDVIIKTALFVMSNTLGVLGSYDEINQIEYEELLRDYTWLDGSPCGVMEEQQ